MFWSAGEFVFHFNECQCLLTRRDAELCANPLDRCVWPTAVWSAHALYSVGSSPAAHAVGLYTSATLSGMYDQLVGDCNCNALAIWKTRRTLRGEQGFNGESECRVFTHDAAVRHLECGVRRAPGVGSATACAVSNGVRLHVIFSLSLLLYSVVPSTSIVPGTGARRSADLLAFVALELRRDAAHSVCRVEFGAIQAECAVVFCAVTVKNEDHGAVTVLAIQPQPTPNAKIDATASQK